MLAARIKARIHRKEQIGEEKEKVAVWLPIFSIGKLNVLKCGRQRVDLADSTRCLFLPISYPCKNSFANRKP